MFNKIGFMWKRALTVCFSVVTRVCITSEYRIIIHPDALFNLKVTFVHML